MGTCYYFDIAEKDAVFLDHAQAQYNQNKYYDKWYLVGVKVIPVYRFKIGILSSFKKRYTENTGLPSSTEISKEIEHTGNIENIEYTENIDVLRNFSACTIFSVY